MLKAPLPLVHRLLIDFAGRLAPFKLHQLLSKSPPPFLAIRIAEPAPPPADLVLALGALVIVRVLL